MNSQDKLDFLASEVMKDMTALVAKVEAAAKTLADTKSAITSSTEFQLAESIKRIEILATTISTSKSGMETAASSVVKELLLGENGPVKKLNDLFLLYQHHSRQSLSWMQTVNNATSSFFKTTLIAGFLCGITGGVVGGVVVRLL